MNNTQCDRQIRVALDVMGGDFAPGEPVKGAAMAIQENDIIVYLVGNTQLIEQELNQLKIKDERLKIKEALDSIKENEQPAIAVIRKPNASINVAARLVKTGEADAIVSMGSTGAVMVSALQAFGIMDGIERPVIGGPIIGFAPNTVIADLGANVDCKPRHLLGFALMGCVVARVLLGINNPSIALLSVGAEESKGNNLVRETFPVIKKSGLNFIGNIEGNDIVNGKANVVLCDGFIGNILMKFCEGLGTSVSNHLNSSLNGILASSELGRITKEIMDKMNFVDAVGGGPVWGVNGVAIVGHGRARAPEIARAIALTKFVIEKNLISEMKKELKNFSELLKI